MRIKRVLFRSILLLDEKADRVEINKIFNTWYLERANNIESANQKVVSSIAELINVEPKDVEFLGRRALSDEKKYTYEGGITCRVQINHNCVYYIMKVGNKEIKPMIHKDRHEMWNAMRVPTFDRYFCLFRYGPILDSRHLCAIHPDVYHYLRDNFNVQHECFAGPINNVLPSFCSLFPEDSAFGGKGDFFKYEIEEGHSYVANPPYIESVMLNMASRIDSLLQYVNARFFVTVPDWENCAANQEMLASKFCVYHKVIPEKFKYYDHVLGKNAPMKFGLLLIVLQSKDFVKGDNEPSYDEMVEKMTF